MSRSLLKSTAVVSAMTSLSRVLGFVRDMIFAWVFGSGAATDAFFVAFRIPNLFRRMFAEGAFSLAFVPVFTEYKEQRSQAELQELVDRVTGTLGLILFGLSVLGVIAAPLLMFVFAPGFVDNPDKYQLAVSMLRLTFPYVLFISLVACAGGILNSFSRFAIPAFTPVLLNLCLIAAAIWLAPLLEQPITALAWGVFIAGMVQLALQLPFLKQLGLLPKPRWGWHTPGVQKIFKLMLPALFGSSVAQINILINTILASQLIDGSVSWLYYTDRLVEFPLGVLGVALATVILPKLSQQHIADSPQAFSQTLDWALRWVLLIGMPATIGLILLAGPLLSTFFQHGAFTADDVIMTSRSLMAYASGLLAFMAVKVLAPGFYARQDTRTPVRIGIVAVFTNVVLNLLLAGPLAHVGLALAAAIAGFVNAGLLFFILLRQGTYQVTVGWRRFALQLMVANIALVAFLLWGVGDLQSWLLADAGQRVAKLAWLVLGGGLGYLLILFCCGIRPHHLIRN